MRNIKLTDEELNKIILDRLQYEDGHKTQRHDTPGHKRFDMSGYGDDDNSCHVYNTNILNLFRDFGIYDCVTFIYLDTYKGSVMFYYQWFFEGGNTHLSYDFSGYGTRDIIFKIIRFFEVNNKKHSRRRMS